MAPSRGRLLAIGFALAAAGLALGSKLRMERNYGSDVPYMDEWYAVGQVLVVPRSAGELHLANFFEAQNEHRIVFSRLIAYGLLVVNRQWDAMLEMTAGAAIHAGFCAALLLLARRFVQGVRFAWVALATVALFVVHSGWENTLQGIQSQFYLLEWGALGMFLLCLPSEPLGRRWWIGWLVGIASLGTMASGFMAAAVVFLMLAGCAAKVRRVAPRDAAGALLLAAIVAGGFGLVVHVPGHDVLRAHSLGQFLAAAAGALSWPAVDWKFSFVILQLPSAILVLRWIRAQEAKGEESVLVALALWTWMQVAAVSAGRGSGSIVGSSRYTDLFAVGAFANGLALAVLCGPGYGFRAWRVFAAGWIALFSFGLWDQARLAQLSLNDIPMLKERERHHLGSFLATGDPSVLSSSPTHELPYPVAGSLAGFLSNPAIRSQLPAGIRPALRLTPDGESRGFQIASAVLPKDGLPTRVWMSHGGPAQFESQPLPGTLLPYLQVAVSGSQGLDASILRLEGSGGGESAPSFRFRDRGWHYVNLAVPAGSPARLVVDVPAGDHVFSFSEPVELGRGSWLNQWLLRRIGILEGTAGVLAASFGLGLLFLDLNPRARGQGPP